MIWKAIWEHRYSHSTWLSPHPSQWGGWVPVKAWTVGSAVLTGKQLQGPRGSNLRMKTKFKASEIKQTDRKPDILVEVPKFIPLSPQASLALCSHTTVLVKSLKCCSKQTKPLHPLLLSPIPFATQSFCYALP